MISYPMRNKVFFDYLDTLIKDGTLTYKKAYILAKMNSTCFPNKSNKFNYCKLGPHHFSMIHGVSVTHIREAIKEFIKLKLIKPHYFYMNSELPSLQEAKKKLPVKAIEIRYEIVKTKTLKRMLKESQI